MPVACQSRDPARSAERANPRWSTKSKADRFVRSVSLFMVVR